MHRILFDLTSTQPDAIGKFHGGSEYAKYIFFQAIKSGISNFDVVYNRSNPIDDTVVSECKKYAIKIHTIEKKLEIESIIVENKFDRFYSASPYTYSELQFNDAEFIFTIHGLRTLEMPLDSHRYFYSKRQPKWIGHLLIKLLYSIYLTKKEKRSVSKLLETHPKGIITDSEHSKFSILSFFPHLTEQQVRVFYAPMELNHIALEERKEDYFLLISANRWIKNNYRALLALDNLFSKGLLSNKRVVILGVENAPKITRVKNKDKFLFLEYVSEKELDDYMKKAYCFIYPTLNEGFGYPPIHAMKCGTPVLASATSAVPEVCGDAASYFNPYSIAEIETRILQIVRDTEFYKQLQSRGIANAKRLKDIQEKHLPQLLNFIFKN